MKILALTIALLLAASPVAAQQQRQQALGASGQTNTSILPNNGHICIEEMVATFCNQAVGPNNSGYGSSTKFSGSSATSGTSAAYGSSAGSGVVPSQAVVLAPPPSQFAGRFRSPTNCATAKQGGFIDCCHRLEFSAQSQLSYLPGQPNWPGLFCLTPAKYWD